MRLILFLALLATAGVASAKGPTEPKHPGWSFSGAFGVFDMASARRGLEVYENVCSACHSLSFVAYRNLTELGLLEEEAKAVAVKHETMDGPDEMGAPFKRPAGLADHFVPPFRNENAARFANGGALPPDLSLIVKARKGGADYVYSILTGYQPTPPGVDLAPGMNFNPYFSGYQIAMPQPLFDGVVQYADGTPASIDQMARDVVQFLTWAAEPNLPMRKAIGFGTMIFLVILTGLFFATKRRIWAHLH